MVLIESNHDVEMLKWAVSMAFETAHFRDAIHLLRNGSRGCIISCVYKKVPTWTSSKENNIPELALKR